MGEFKWVKKGHEGEISEMSDKIDIKELNLALAEKEKEKEKALTANYDSEQLRAETLGNIQTDIEDMQEILAEHNQ